VRTTAEELVPEQPVTVSAGGATFPGDASDPADLMRHADIALYAGKRAGRDRGVGYAHVVAEVAVGTGPGPPRAPHGAEPHGRALAFQAIDGGSTPLARSSAPRPPSPLAMIPAPQAVASREQRRGPAGRPHPGKYR